MFRRAVHPGQILKDELAELEITPTDFAHQIDVPTNRISQIIAGKRSVTGDSALRFGHWFGVDPQFWLEPPGSARSRRGRREVRCSCQRTAHSSRKQTVRRLPFRQGLIWATRISWGS